MSDEGLRAALEAKLATLPVMAYENGYPVQALPKAELLGLLALNPPSRICGDTLRSFGVDLLCRKPVGHDAEHQDVHGATWTPLPHLTDDGAAAPPTDRTDQQVLEHLGSGAAAESATPTAAPSSPHRTAFDVAYNIVNQIGDLWEVPVDVRQASNDRCWEFAAELIDAFGEGATPAIDRATIMLALYEDGAYCGNCDYETAHFTDTGVTFNCDDCERVLGMYADTMLALIEGAR